MQRKAQHLVYRCPIGGNVIRAANARELRRKAIAHNIYSHGPRPLVICGKAR
jgi:hypothetical protein